MRALKESFVAWIAIHQLRKENGFRRRSSSRCASRTVTTSELLRGVGMGNVKGKSARRASMGEVETIPRLGRVLSKAVDHARVAGWQNFGRKSVALILQGENPGTFSARHYTKKKKKKKKSVALTHFPSLLMVSDAQYDTLRRAYDSVARRKSSQTVSGYSRGEERARTCKTQGISCAFR